MVLIYDNKVNVFFLKLNKFIKWTGVFKLLHVSYTDFDCGDIINLNDTNNKVTIISPTIKGVKKDITCYWFMKVTTKLLYNKGSRQEQIKYHSK
jgi:hypothetical protein